jgi:hypothetical protein
LHDRLVAELFSQSSNYIFFIVVLQFRHFLHQFNNQLELLTFAPRQKSASLTSV